MFLLHGCPKIIHTHPFVRIVSVTFHPVNPLIHFFDTVGAYSWVIIIRVLKENTLIKR